MRHWTSWSFMMLAAALPATRAAGAGTEIAIAAGPGRQAEPVVSGTAAAYTDSGAGAAQVWSHDLTTGQSARVAPSSSAQGSPAIAGNLVAFLDFRSGQPEIWIRDLGAAAASSRIGRPAVPSQPTLSTRLLAWRDARSNPPRVWVLDLSNDHSQPAGGSGSQSSPAAAGRYAVYLSDDTGAIRLYDADTQASSQIYAGPAASPHTDGANVTFVDLAAAPGEIAVASLDGARRATLSVAGEQRAPRISGEWVAFEDLSTGISQLAIWHWSSGELYYPAPAGTSQSASDLSYPWVVYSDGRAGDEGVYAEQLDLVSPQPPDGGMDGGGGADGGTDAEADGGTDGGIDGGVAGVRCDDPAVVPLATLEVTLPQDACGGGQPERDCWGDDDGHPGHPERHDRDHHRPPQRCLAAGHQLFEVEQATRVLLCVEGASVDKGWVALGRCLVAGDDQLGPAMDHLEVHAEAKAGKNALAVALQGKAGATLTVRVLEDPVVGPPADGGCRAGCLQDGLGRIGGCGAGGTGLLALALLGLVPIRAWRVRRR